MRKDVLLDQAKALINGDRNRDYGEPGKNHERIAQVWSMILGHEVLPGQVVAMMIGVKLARLAHEVDNEDSWRDIAGYAAIGGEITSSAAERDPQTTKQ